ncbi:MAG: complex I subunit 4 family protein, partial [Candidatus Binatia bacterium]
MAADALLLSAIIFLPAVASLFLLAFDHRAVDAMRYYGVAVTALTFVLSLFLLWDFNPDDPNMQMTVKYTWIAGWNINYQLGVDGISLVLVLLTTFITFLAMLASWNIKEQFRGYLILFLVLETGMLGVFLALDFFLFYVFWEVMLLPMYFLIGIWGGPRKEYAAIKFFLYTLAGGVLMLIALLMVYFNSGRNFDLIELSAMARQGQLLSPTFQQIAFVLLFIGFAIKLPAVPFHTWLPDAHVEAPTAGSVLLAGVMLKIGTYGFLRFAVPFFPQ